MKKLFFSLVILLSIGFLWFKVTDLSNQKAKQESQQVDNSIQKKEILRFALVADSHGDNQNLKIALGQAKSSGASFVIGLGDYTEVGTRGQLSDSKKIFDLFDFEYYFTAGDHDLWDSRDKQSLRSSTSSAGLKGDDALTNFRSIFGQPTHIFNKKGVEFVIVDNSDIYKGINDSEWLMVNSKLKEGNPKLKFVFSHKTPYHPQSAHIMGSENAQVAKQAKDFMDLMEKNKVDGFFSGDLHFFAEFSSRGRSTSGGKSTDGVKITTVGAIDSERNFQGPRFAIVKVYSDYSWDVEDLEIK